ncbi:hypothetical protein KLVA111896_12365 [Klebsiella variicola]|nr:hypothetical protein SB5610_03473 [Klebsiella variicola]
MALIIFTTFNESAILHWNAVSFFINDLLVFNVGILIDNRVIDYLTISSFDYKSKMKWIVLITSRTMNVGKCFVLTFSRFTFKYI